MIRAFWRSALAWLKRAISQPREELDRWQSAARFVYDLLRYGAWQLRHDRAGQMAAALAFRSLFALVPVLIVAMIVVNSVQGTDGFLALIGRLAESLHLDEVRIAPEAAGLDGAEVAETKSLAEWLSGLARQAAEIQLATVGWIGLAVIIYAAVSLMKNIESAFNTIYRAPQGRSWMRAMPLYWFILTVGPIALGVLWLVDARVAAWIDAVPVGRQLLLLLQAVWGLGKDWLIFLMIYTLVPNTRVRLGPAAAGALVAALLFTVGEQVLALYLRHAFAVSQLYGSLGLVPLFMFWAYFVWLAVLFGLEVSATLQALRGRHLDEMQPEPQVTVFRDPAVIFTVMEFVAEDFAAGRSSTAASIAESCALPASAVSALFERLVKYRVLNRVDGDEERVCLARAPESISAAELIDVAFQLVDDDSRGRPSGLIDRLREAQRNLASQQTLAGLRAAGG